MPRVSVLIPMYNAEKYIKQTIESLLDQTYRDLEVIVINDASDDNGAEVVRSIKDDRLIFIDNKEKHGVVYTLNWCLELAKGEYIARSDADDWSYPTRIEEQVKYMDEHPEVCLLGTQNYVEINGHVKKKMGSWCTVGRHQIRYSLPFANEVFAHSSFMLRGSVMRKNDIKYEVFEHVQDYHLIMRMSEFGEIERIDKPLIVYRVYDTQSTRLRSLKMRIHQDDLARAMFIDKLDLNDSEKKALKKGMLRELKTLQDIEEFNSALNKYAKQCGIDERIDKKNVRFLYARNMVYQYCDLYFLINCLKTDFRMWMLTGYGLLFIAKCLLKRNINRVQTDIEI